jgi:hypothetical protein
MVWCTWPHTKIRKFEFANLTSGKLLVNLETVTSKITYYGQNSLKDLAKAMTTVGAVAWTGIPCLVSSLFLTLYALSYFFVFCPLAFSFSRF